MESLKSPLFRTNKFFGNELALLAGCPPPVPGFTHSHHTSFSAPTSVRDLNKSRLLPILWSNRLHVGVWQELARGQESSMRLITRREAVRWLSSASAGAWLAGRTALKFGRAPAFGERSPKDSGPSLAPGAPTSPQRMALIEAFRKRSEGLRNKFEARTHKSDWEMPYRLFRPEAARGKIPLVVYLHGSGGLGDDNLKQLAFGNIFGTRLWLLPENQKAFPCYVVAPQTDREWIRYDFSQQPAKELPGFGDGNRLALEIVDGLGREFGIDERRIYVGG